MSTAERPRRRGIPQTRPGYAHGDPQEAWSTLPVPGSASPQRRTAPGDRGNTMASRAGHLVMTRTLTQPLTAETAGHSRQFQLIVDIHLLLVANGDLLLGRRANTGYGDGAYEPPSGRLAERETLVEAAVRVAADQMGIALAPADVSLAHVLHDVSGAGRMAFFLTADGWSGEAGPRPRPAAAGSYSDFG